MVLLYMVRYKKLAANVGLHFWYATIRSGNFMETTYS